MSRNLGASRGEAGGTARRVLRRLGLGFLRSRRGASTVEYGLINIPFVIFLFGFVEFAWQATTAVLLDASAVRAARFGVTGQSAPTGAPSSIACRSISIPWLVAQSSGGILSAERLTVTTDTVGRIGDIGSSAATRTGSAGLGGDFVTYTLTYRQPLLTTVWLPSTDGSPNVVHRASFTVKNEPFTNAVC